MEGPRIVTENVSEDAKFLQLDGRMGAKIIAEKTSKMQKMWKSDRDEAKELEKRLINSKVITF